MGSALEALTGGVEAGSTSPAFHAPDAPKYTYFEFGAMDEFEGAKPLVKCLIGDGSEGNWIQTTGGFGHWDIVARPYLPSLTVWRGPTESYSHKIPFMLDGWTNEHSEIVEQGCRNIEKLAGVLSKPGSD